MDSAATPNNNEELTPPACENDGKCNFINYFAQALFEPISTLKKLCADSAAKNEPLWFDAFLVVFLAGAIFGCVRAHRAGEVLYHVSSGIIDYLLYWYFVSSILFGLSKMIGTRKYTFKECAGITGVIFAPLVLLGLLGCLAALPLLLYAAILTLPIYWSIYLLSVAYRTALGISYIQIILLLMVAPPLLFLVYAFWIGSAVFMLIGTILRSS